MPLVPSPAEMALGWSVSLTAGAIWVGGLVSLARGPLDARARLPWAVAMLILPVLGALIWLWWRHRYYPARRREQPGWDPNRREVAALPPSRGSRTPAPSRRGRPDPYAGHAAPEGLLPRRRFGMEEFAAPAGPGRERGDDA